MSKWARLAFVLVGLCALCACTADQRHHLAEFFGGFFNAAAPVAAAAGQPLIGQLFSWAGHVLTAHPYESAGAGLAAAVPVKHYLLGGVPGTKKHRDGKAVKAAKREAAKRVKAQMAALDAETAHRKIVEAAEAKMRRATARKNAAFLAAQRGETEKSP